MKRQLIPTLLTLMVSHANAQIVVGATYPVIERDPTIVIRESLSKLDLPKLLANRKESFRHQYQQIVLPRASEPVKRSHIPFYTVEHDVTDKDGKVIYPTGYVYNPLLYFKLPHAIYAIDQGDTTWLKPLLKQADMVLLNSGDLAEVSNELQHAVYLLDDNTRTRLDLLRVPSKVTQIQSALMIEESVNAF
ncbi:MAG: hypothetical protein HPY59_07570 [Anaerolineae bacterium]|nr:hypothetical protein [Anaerolineae bacterium]